MSDISSTQLRSEIQSVLKDADLSTISAKRVREQVESKLNCSLLSRKKEFDKIVMEVINEQQEDDDDDDEEDDGKDPDAEPADDSEPSEEEEAASSSEEEKQTQTKKKPAPKKRPQPTKHKQSKKKRKSLNADDSGTESDAGSDSDYEVVKKPAPKKKAAKSGGGSGSGGTPRKSTGFTRAYNLSPELSALMGADSLPRHEVVKKVWAIIKERDLYDPKNKQFAICDDELMKVMKIKRFRTFGMLKHLKPHFLTD
ncbi:upstream activation factor subunit spp27 [Drosophila grimshawi]|uniref:GH16267 n=1 Tax=Drosophila grimshawi TaxID=7222 RepID=B4IXV2_DROGR|nr:upstream activation factor subunit spp27 [Drosophila grimshawi]EDV96473.1 GH16267 [Drosophila grimshawi]